MKFLQLRSTDGDEDFDPIVLPTVNIYRDKAIIACFTRVGFFINTDCLTNHVEDLLQAAGIRAGPHQ